MRSPTTVAAGPSAPLTRAPEEARSFRWHRALLALAVALMGAIDLASALLSHPPERLRALLHLVPSEVLETSRTFTLLAGGLLLVTAWGLRRGKRRAYVLALFLCAISVPVNLLKAFDLEEAIVATSLMFLLAINSEAFQVKSRQITGGVLGGAALWGFLALVAYALAGDWVLRSAYAVEPSWSRAFADAAWRIFGIGNPVTLLPEHLPPGRLRMVTWYLRSLPMLSLAGVVFVAIAALKPASHRRRHRLERERVREILREHGDSSVAWFALEDSTDYLFSRNGRAVVAYRFERDVLLGIGDPIGPAEEHLPLLADLDALCRASDWTPALYQARPQYLPLYQSLGWNALHIGVDPVLDPATFSLEGAAIGDVRRSVHKCEQAGIVVRHFMPGATPFVPSALPPGWLDQMRAISSEWLRARAGGEKGFCMGRFDPHALADAWVAVAWNERTARVEAFASWVPIPARRGWALDLMRRTVHTHPGAMELLVVRSVEAARARGDAVLSLSLSPLAGAGDPASASPAIGPAERRARDLLRRQLAPYYDFEGVFTWKKKFVPRFEDRYLIYPWPFALPAVALALVRAQSPEGLLAYAPAWLRRKPDVPAAVA